MLINTC